MNFLVAPVIGRAWIAVLLGACGRIGFGPLDPIDAPIGDRPSADASACLATACPPFASFCEGFETTAPPTFSPWNDVQVVNYGGGAVDPASHMAIASTPSCDGKVLESQIGGAAQWGQIFKALAPRPNPTYARAMMYVPSTNPVFGVDTLGFGNLTNEYLLVGLRTDNSIALSTSQAIGGVSAGPVIVRDRWQCVEMSVLFAPAAGHVSVWIDGNLVLDANGPTENSGSLDHLIMGISTGATTTGVTTIYFDDVAFAGQRIGCN